MVSATFWAVGRSDWLVRSIRLFLEFLIWSKPDWQALAHVFLLLIRVRFGIDSVLIRFWFALIRAGSLWIRFRAAFGSVLVRLTAEYADHAEIGRRGAGHERSRKIFKFIWNKWNSVALKGLRRGTARCTDLCTGPRRFPKRLDQRDRLRKCVDRADSSPRPLHFKCQRAFAFASKLPPSLRLRRDKAGVTSLATYVRSKAVLLNLRGSSSRLNAASFLAGREDGHKCAVECQDSAAGF